jgi:hypothetical protein
MPTTAEGSHQTTSPELGAIAAGERLVGGPR